MAFQLDISKIVWPPPGSFEAGILKSIEVPFQKTEISGGEYPPRPLPEGTPPPSFTLNLEEMVKIRFPPTEETP